MTNQEAYDHIKSRLREYIQCTADNIALYTALEALEKQIAKENLKNKFLWWARTK